MSVKKKLKRLLFFAVGTAVMAFTPYVCACSSSQENDAPTWRSGIFTALSLSVESDGNTVKAVARNDFTLGLATLPVEVYLYADAQEKPYAEMEKIAEKRTGDLDIFSSLSAETELTEGYRFYVARMRYKDANGVWQEKTTAPVYLAHVK